VWIDYLNDKGSGDSPCEEVIGVLWRGDIFIKEVVEKEASHRLEGIRWQIGLSNWLIWETFRDFCFLRHSCLVLSYLGKWRFGLLSVRWWSWEEI